MEARDALPVSGASAKTNGTPAGDTLADAIDEAAANVLGDSGESAPAPALASVSASTFSSRFTSAGIRRDFGF